MLSSRSLLRGPSLIASLPRSKNTKIPTPRSKPAVTTITNNIAIAYLSTSTVRLARMTEFKLKNAKSLDLKNGEKQEFEVEGIENGKVLVCKVNDKVHALSPNCTHYGAPLKLGVLTPSGRLTCAWHGGW